MKTADDAITPDDAKSMLDKDRLNRTNALLKGGKLSEADRKKLNRIVKRAATEKKPAAPKGKRQQKVTIDPKDFEGSFEQKRRRRKVYELRLRTYTIREMAEELDVMPKTIVADLKAIDEALLKSIDPLNATAIINETLMDLEAVRMMAMDGLKEAEGNEKNGLLNTITAATKVKIELLQDAGTLPKATMTLKHTGPDGGPLPTAAVNIAHIHVHTTATETPETKRLRAELPGRYEIVDVSRGG